MTDDVPMIVRGLAVLVGLVSIGCAWRAALRLTPRTARAVERWAVMLVATGGLVLAIGGVLLASWLLPGLVIGAGAGAVLGWVKMVAPAPAPLRHTRTPPDWMER